MSHLNRSTIQEMRPYEIILLLIALVAFVGIVALGRAMKKAIDPDKMKALITSEEIYRVMPPIPAVLSPKGKALNRAAEACFIVMLLALLMFALPRFS